MANSFARHLRKNMPDAERRLWYHLRRKNVAGHRFRRQVAIGPYVVDFVCLDTRLIVELDGGQHATDAERDAKRDAWLKTQGFQLLRFWNHQVFEDSDAVLEAIRRALEWKGS